MDVLNYLANNVPLFSICLVMILLSIRNIKIKKTESILSLVFTGIVLFLSVVVAMEKYALKVNDIYTGTIFSSLGYILRPMLLVIIIFLANVEEQLPKKIYFILSIPLLANILVYLCPLFFNVPVLSKMVFYYEIDESGVMQFYRGGFLNFSSHFFCFLYLLVLAYVSTIRLHGLHRKDGLVVILCVVIILITVVTEMIANRNDLLNIISEICLMTNYIFIVSVNASRDPLTHLYDRGTYYEDIGKYQGLVNGIIQMDMNGLKYLNDNFGHHAGDAALAEFANIFEKSINHKNMCAYRLSGDEFLILMFQGKKEELDHTVELIKQRTKESKNSIAIGYIYYDKNDNLKYDEALKKAEELMYIDKDNYYQDNEHKRR